MGLKRDSNLLILVSSLLDFFVFRFRQNEGHGCRGGVPGSGPAPCQAEAVHTLPRITGIARWRPPAASRRIHTSKTATVPCIPAVCEQGSHREFCMVTLHKVHCSLKNTVQRALRIAKHCSELQNVLRTLSNRITACAGLQ